MATLDDLIKSDITKGVAIGLGIAAAGVMLAPALRPTARTALKTGLVLFEKGREWMAEAGEQFDDLLAEVRAELIEEREAAETLGAATMDETVESGEVHA